MMYCCGKEMTEHEYYTIHLPRDVERLAQIRTMDHSEALTQLILKLSVKVGHLYQTIERLELQMSRLEEHL